MKTILLSVLLLSHTFILAQTNAKVVVAVNKGDSINQQWIVRQLYNLKIAIPSAEVEVVCYGAGLQTLISKTCTIAEDIKKLNSQGVVFAACENSMAGLSITKEQLISECITVKAGVAQLVLRQSQNWQYIYGSR